MGKETRISHKNTRKIRQTSMKGSLADGCYKIPSFTDVSRTDSVSILLVPW
jgi:hypothetical protein